VFMHTPFGSAGRFTGICATLVSRLEARECINEVRPPKQPYFFSKVAKFGIAPGSDSVQPGFAGPDADRFLDVGDEDLAVADAPGLRGAPDRIDRALDQVVADHDLDLHLGQEVDDVFGTAVKFGMTLLAPKALRFGDRDALEADFLKRLF